MSVGAPAQILSGKYRLERLLGRGGMGAVWQATHLTLRSPVAVKLIEPDIARNPEALSRFLREARAAAALRSPHVVQILDHGVDAGVPFIVMELLEGETLAARLARVRCLSPAETARILTHVARAMTKAHEAGVVHRDLKPDNIFLVQNDEEELAKVLDFGIAKSRTHGLGPVSSTTRTGSVLGTPFYMSPEQVEGAKHLDHRTDVWAMGVIAWECLLGARPFEAETLGSLLLAICARDMPTPSRRGAVPPGFDAWFARACSREIEQRFATAREAAAELLQICAGEGAHHAAAPRADRGALSPLASAATELGLSAAYEPVERSAAPWIALGLVALAVVGGGVVIASRSAGSAAVAGNQAPPRVVSRTPLPLASALPVSPSVAALPAPAPAPSAPASNQAGAAPSAKRAVGSAAPKPAIRPRPATAPAPAPQPDEAKPSPAPAVARPRVDLGI